ncbi:MAG: hypothetical protein Q7R96_05450 [Nanoarchaeota archaeon]|nr:hypothetical protein [Nanoarchaeota archaeon]
MNNPFTSLDAIVMDGVNIINKTWNCTTGYTRADLCTLLFVGSAVPQVAQALSSEDPILEMSLTLGSRATFIGAAYYFQYTEQKLLPKRVLNYGTELWKKAYKVLGYYSIHSAVILPFIPTSTMTPTQALGFALLGLGLITLSADNLPPQKNCVARGIDKLTKMIKKYKPALV